MLNRHGKNNEDGSFDWKDAAVDAGIMAGLTFFTTIGAMGATGLLDNPVLGIVSAAIAFGTEFFLILAIKRGLKEKE